MVEKKVEEVKKKGGILSEDEIDRMMLQEEKDKHPERFGIGGKRRSWKQRH